MLREAHTSSEGYREVGQTGYAESELSLPERRRRLRLTGSSRGNTTRRKASGPSGSSSKPRASAPEQSGASEQSGRKALVDAKAAERGTARSGGAATTTDVRSRSKGGEGSSSARSLARVTSRGRGARRVSGHDANRSRVTGDLLGGLGEPVRKAHRLGARLCASGEAGRDHLPPAEDGSASANCAGPDNEPTTVRWCVVALAARRRGRRVFGLSGRERSGARA